MNEPEYVIWVDPGITNGVAHYFIRQDRMIMEEMTDEELSWRLRAWLSTAGQSTMVGVEKFIITPQTFKYRDADDTIQTIGMIKTYARDYMTWGFDNSQTPAEAKSYCPDDVLKDLHWYTVTMGHANDAARHVWLWLNVRGIAPAHLYDKVSGSLTT